MVWSLTTCKELLRGVAKKTVYALVVAIAVFALCIPSFPQGAIGTIHGGVFDSSGGAIAGAKVTILDVARGTTRTLTTDASGQYVAPSLLSGTYTVRAASQGFQTIERTNVTLEVAQDVRVDLTLTPGTQAQTVTVTEVAPAIDTTNSTLGGTVTNTSVANLPLVSRNFLQLLQLRPGVVDVPGGNGTSTTTNGRREGTDVLLIEGVTQFDLATSNVLINGAQKGGAVNELPLDSVQEFSTQQNPQAEYGWRDGSSVNVAVKSGTNSLHGSAYAFGRDAAATDAKQFSAVGSEAVGNTTWEQPGFTLGAPIIKDKLFFFVSAEFIRSNSFSPASVTSPSYIAGAGASLSLVDACTAAKAGTGVSALSAQLSGLNPATCAVTPASATVENLWPVNLGGAGIIFPHAITSAPSNNGLAKVDYSPNEKNHFDGFFFISRETTDTASNYLPLWSVLGIGKTEEYAGAWTYTPNSSWVNDLRGGAAPNVGNSIPADVSKDPATAWASGGYGFNQGNTGFGLACINVGGIFPSSSTGLGDCGKNGPRGPQYQLDFTDKVSYLHGNHAFKWGYEEVFVHFDDGSTANLNGTVSFTNLTNFLEGNITKNGSVITGDNTDHYREHWHAAFFQDTWRITPRITLTPGIRWEYIGSPHSTVNKMGTFDPAQAGGAIQVGSGLPTSTVIHPEKANFNPRVGVAWDIFGKGKTVLRAGIGNLSSFPAILTVTGSQVPYGNTLCTVTPASGQPCSGAGVFINRYGTTQNATTPNTFSITAGPVTMPGTMSANWASNGTTPLFPSSSVTATSGPQCTPGSQCSMLVSDPNFKYPKSLQWNIDIQHAITNSLTLDVAYVGVHGYDETRSVDLNEPALGSGWNPNSATQQMYITGCLGTTLGSPVAQTQPTAAAFVSTCAPDTKAEQTARPYNVTFPYFKYIVQTRSGFKSNYDGLQVTLDSRGYHGLSFLTAYTYSHALDDWTKSSQATSAPADPANPQYQYGNSDMDVRHRLRFSPTYQIPGIKTPGQMLEGWQVSAIWAWQGGFAWAPNDQSSNDWGGTGENGDSTIPRPNNGVWQSWNYTGPHSAFSNAGDVPIPCYGAAPSCTSWATAPVAIWNTCSAAATAPYSTPQLQDLALAALTSGTGACYMQKGGILTPPAYGTLGNATRGLFTGPSFQDVDVSLQKTWHIRERYQALLRIEVYNVFNHVNYNQFSDGSSDPSAGGGNLNAGNTFGFATTGQLLSGISPNRQFQFGLKLLF